MLEQMRPCTLATSNAIIITLDTQLWFLLTPKQASKHRKNNNKNKPRNLSISVARGRRQTKCTMFLL
jgi:hypothetical protein